MSESFRPEVSFPVKGLSRFDYRVAAATASRAGGCDDFFTGNPRAFRLSLTSGQVRSMFGVTSIKFRLGLE